MFTRYRSIAQNLQESLSRKNFWMKKLIASRRPHRVRHYWYIPKISYLHSNWFIIKLNITNQNLVQMSQLYDYHVYYCHGNYDVSFPPNRIIGNAMLFGWFWRREIYWSSLNIVRFFRLIFPLQIIPVSWNR